MGLYLLIALGGAFAGFIGTLAGLASVLTMYILIEMGLDGDVANATNRVGILAMALMALPTFYRKGHLDIERSWPIIVTIFIGAIGGFILALNVDGEFIRKFFKYLLVIMLALVLTNPKKWIRKTNRKHQMNYALMIPIYLVVGFYAGFIQLGTGVFLVVSLALMGKYSLVDANGVKLSAFALYTSFGIVLFAMNGLINWEIGATLAVGQGFGAYVAARFATSYPKANSFVRYLLIVMLVVGIIKSFKLYEYVISV